MECLNNIIGVTQSDCNCVIDGLTDEQIQNLRKSTSGLYLNENLEGGINLKDIKLLSNCKEYYEIAISAIDAAKRMYYDDVRIGLASKYKSNKPKFIGSLGNVAYAGVQEVKENLQFLKIESNTIGNATMKINGIRLVINESKKIDLSVGYIIDGDTVYKEIFKTNVEASANRFSNVKIPGDLHFPLMENGKKMNYYVVWEKTANENPLDNNVSCGCSGGDAYSSYVVLKGGESNNYDDIFNSKTDNYARGISVDAEMFCDSGNIICDEFKKGDALSLVTAWAILFKAGELIIEKVLNSSEITRFTMMSREYLWGKRNHFRSEYVNRIAYLMDNIDITSSDCFICKENKMFVGNIYGKN